MLKHAYSSTLEEEGRLSAATKGDDESEGESEGGDGETSGAGGAGEGGEDGADDGLGSGDDSTRREYVLDTAAIQRAVNLAVDYQKPVSEQTSMRLGGRQVALPTQTQTPTPTITPTVHLSFWSHPFCLISSPASSLSSFFSPSIPIPGLRLSDGRLQRYFEEKHEWV